MYGHSCTVPIGLVRLRLCWPWWVGERVRMFRNEHGWVELGEVRRKGRRGFGNRMRIEVMRIEEDGVSERVSVCGIHDR